MQTGDPTEEQLFTEIELRRYDGDNGPMYVAFQGIIYDVTNCPKWHIGLHEGLHFPGQDLSTEINEAPHAAEVFRRPCVKRVGRLVTPPTASG